MLYVNSLVCQGVYCSSWIIGNPLSLDYPFLIYLFLC